MLFIRNHLISEYFNFNDRAVNSQNRHRFTKYFDFGKLMQTHNSELRLNVSL